MKILDVPVSDLDIIKVTLKEYAYSSFKNYSSLKELNLSNDEYDVLIRLSSLKYCDCNVR